MQELLDLLIAEMKELEVETRGTWSEIIRLMGFSCNISPAIHEQTRVDESILKDSRAKIQDMLKKVGTVKSCSVEILDFCSKQKFDYKIRCASLYRFIQSRDRKAIQCALCLCAPRASVKLEQCMGV